MINLQLMSMKEYFPVNGDMVVLFLLSRSFGLTGLKVVTGKCEIHYQGYHEGIPVPNCTSNTSEKMLLVPFNSPFAHIYVGDRITGFRLLNTPREQDAEEVYWEKRWYFDIEDQQIPDDDPDNEVLGIMNQEEFSKELLQ